MTSNNSDNEIYSYSDHRINNAPQKSESIVNLNSPQTPKQNKNNRKKKILAKKITTVSCVLLILVGTVVAISFSGGLNAKKQVAESSVAVSSNNKAAQAAVSAQSSEPQKPTYSPKVKFATNLNRLSASTINALNNKLTSEFMVLYDATTDEIVYQKNGTKKCYPAGTTKLLTAIVASSIISPKTQITVGNEIKLIGQDSSTAGLQVGDKLTFEMLMDALLLPSGNDAAYTMAVNAAKIYKNDKKLSDKEAVSIFMQLVNDAAKQLNTTGTHYVTPDGWHNDNHYTCAEDLAKIASYARTIPIIKNSVCKACAKWKLIKGGNAEWYNSNQLLLSGSGLYSPYVDGMKTGFTDQAGSSVVASATMNGHTFIAVVMNGQTLYTKYDDANTLFKAGFKLYNFDYTYG